MGGYAAGDMGGATAGRFGGRSAMVSGAASGIGFAIAQRLGADGARVVLADLNEEAVAAAGAKLSADGVDALPFAVDVTNAAQVKELAAFARDRHGPVQLLVNAAGVLRGTPAVEIPDEEWDLVVNANLKGTFLCSQSVQPQMVAAGGGSIVNLASMAGRATSTLGGVHYTAAKAGVLGLTRHLAREWAPLHINCNAVSPGIVDTPMIHATNTPEHLEQVRQSIPFKRFADPGEIASLVCFLLSDEASYITGASVDIHGGELIIQ